MDSELFEKSEISGDYRLGNIQADKQTFYNTTRAFNFKDFYNGQKDKLGLIMLTPYQVIVAYTSLFKEAQIFHDGLEYCIARCISEDKYLEKEEQVITVKCYFCDKFNMFVPATSSKEITKDMAIVLREFYKQLKKAKVDIDDSLVTSMESFCEYNRGIKLVDTIQEIPNFQPENIIGIPIKEYLNKDRRIDRDEGR